MPQLSLIIAKNNRLKIPISFMQFIVILLAILFIYIYIICFFFFWVDAQLRMAYQYFGDVVTFDTTYKTNKYDMPFAPFMGLNHRCQSILFGCALLQDETEQTFVWLFETWLQAIWGKKQYLLLQINF